MAVSAANIKEKNKKEIRKKNKILLIIRSFSFFFAFFLASGSIGEKRGSWDNFHRLGATKEAGLYFCAVLRVHTS